jgi:hypothetical protein
MLISKCAGNRFAFEGIYNSRGELQPDIVQAGTQEWNLLCYAATSLGMQVHIVIIVLLIALFYFDG